MKPRTALLALLTLSLLPLYAHAERSITFGDYEVHYNAFRSDTIPPEVARHHNIIRSNHRALINITVLKRDKAGATHAVPAHITGTATNLSNQLSSLQFFPVQEQDTIYYLDQFRIDDNETLKFQIRIEPDQPHATTPTIGELNFSQRFFTEK